MAREATSSNGNTLYLQINSNGKLYRGATDQEKSAYEAALAENPNYNGMDIAVAKVVNEKTGATYYHKQYNCTEFGKIHDIGIVENKFTDGTIINALQIWIQPDESPDSKEVVVVPIVEGEKLSRKIKGITAILGNIDPKISYSISPSRYQTQSGHYNTGIYFNYFEGGEQTFVKNKLNYKNEKNPAGEIPPPIEETSFSGKSVWNFKEQDNFLYKELIKEIDRINKELNEINPGRNRPTVRNSKPVSNEQSNPPKQDSKTNKVTQQTPSTPPMDSSDIDDLPF